jgi:pyridoxal phosphate enzyme (YggS family)
MQRKISKNISLLKKSISNASLKANIDPNQISLIAVSKKQSNESIKAALDLGILNFGENYAQELAIKAEFFKNKDIGWHFIGPIQTNKIKLIAKHASWVHSLDRIKVVDRLNKECITFSKQINVLIQVNISGEETKSGIKPDNLLEFADYVNLQSNIILKGIMVLPRITSSIKETGIEMAKAKKLHSLLIDKFPHANQLSMGTTSDFECAIEFGSNMIRVGELIFGKRK